MRRLPIGSTIGILGGGQLGRMTALAAAQMGYKTHIFCPNEEEPAVEVASRATQGLFDDDDALARFAQAVDVVTLEWENVPLSALKIVELTVPVFPSPEVLAVAQDRRLEKEFARRAGLGTADYAALSCAQELEEALARFARPAVLKSARMGYDGKGQVKIEAGLSAQEAWEQMGAQEAILESFVPFEKEISVIVARREDGVCAAYPPVCNTHKNHILFETRFPAEIEQEVAREAELAALRLAEELKVVGLLAVEMFVIPAPDGQGRRLLVNEIAPRPHNSGHWTMDACACSQFEQLVRAICGLPLGETTPHSRAVMRNLLGDEAAAAIDLLADPSACLHIYGKKDSRPGRKMGHVTFLEEL